jgi:hypothetical protein
MLAALSERYQRNEHIVTREILGETLLVPISVAVADMDNIFALNDTGAFVWHRRDGALTLSSIRESMPDALDVSEEQAGSDIQVLIDDLLDAGLVGKLE